MEFTWPPITHKFAEYAGGSFRLNKLAKVIIISISAFTVAFLSLSSARAVQISTQATAFGCLQNGTNFSQCQSNFSNANGASAEFNQARAEIGSLGVSALATQTISSTAGGVTSTGGPGQGAFASFTDELTFGVQEGIFRVDVNITGEIGIDSAGNGLSASSAIVGFNLGKRQALTTVFSDVLRLIPTQGGSVLVTERTTTGSFGRSTVDIAFADGSLSLIGELSAAASCGQQRAVSGQGASCTASASFFNSATLLGAVILDTNGLQLPDVEINSASGFDYSVGFTSVVPVPAALPLFATGLAFMGFIGWRRKRKAIAQVAAAA